MTKVQIDKAIKEALAAKSIDGLKIGIAYKNLVRTTIIGVIVDGKYTRLPVDSCIAALVAGKTVKQYVPAVKAAAAAPQPAAPQPAASGVTTNVTPPAVKPVVTPQPQPAAKP